jgi:glycosyltransferase involved in cell wall biosynthesis
MKASIIICTFNEEKTIADVVTSCCRFNPDCEVIVVNDGSTDHTNEILRDLSNDYSFKYEELKENMGKSWAMAHGVEVASSEVILFFDADVSFIRKEHFENLLRPIRENSAEMVLGQPTETLFDYRINPFKSLTGERALLKKDLLPILDEIREIRFGIETFLNLYYQAKGKRIIYVLMHGLKHPSTYEKTGSVKVATKKYIKEGNEIALTITRNYDLINQRVEFLIGQTNMNTKKKIKLLQNDLNNKLLELREKLNL